MVAEVTVQQVLDGVVPSTPAIARQGERTKFSAERVEDFTVLADGLPH
jgi:hypothetical protein